MDDQQQTVVEAPLAPLLVVAGAGTGKTRTLTHRVCHWIDRGLTPERTLLVTFTQRAAQEMSDRIGSLNSIGGRPWVGTFHHIAARLLRDYAHQFNYGADFQIMDYSRCQRLMNAVLEKSPPLPPNLTANHLLRAYSLTVNADKSLSDLVAQKRLLPNADLDLIDAIYIDYLVMKIEHNCMDFDDLLLYLNQLLSKESACHDDIRSRFDALFVDEYQDVNPLQVSILDALAHAHERMTVVGDDKQSIYGFRGSDVNAILNFENRYPNARVLHLTNNYRSSPQIIALANQSVSNNPNQRPLKLNSIRSDGPMPVIKDFLTSAEQARFVCEEIKRLNGHGVPFFEQAVLYRTHSQSRELELALGEFGIPYTLRSGRRLFERPHIRPLFDLLSFISGDEIALENATILEIFEGIGPRSSQEIVSQIKRLGSFQNWVQHEPEHIDVPARLRDPIIRVHSCLRSIFEALKLPLFQCLTQMRKSVLDPWIRRSFDDADSRMKDLVDCIRMSLDFAEPTDFLDALTLASDTVRQDQGVVLSTVHRAKGLEWASVFIVGLADGSFPLLGRDRGIDMAEERRLFYVALTRCQRWLYLCHAWQEHTNGSILAPSRFLREIGGSEHYPDAQHQRDEEIQ
ncbi:MAG: ATP-dependent helicase [Myxococcota bacterium]|nr:ATP-dependent helicase [Myxococcota bacterium]